MKKNLLFILFVSILILGVSCSKSDDKGPFDLLTTPTWRSDSLLVDGEDASGPGALLEKFKGEAKFRRDGTGYFGVYIGSWRFTDNSTAIIITTDSLPIPLTTKIAELTEQSLKITTAYPSLTNPNEEMKIRMTFKAK